MSAWNKVAIIGVGLIGGSIGCALRKRSLAGEVVGIVRREASGQAALAVGAVDRFTTELTQGVSGADLVVVCTGVGQIVEHVRQAGEHCLATALLTDVGSTKRAIVEQLTQVPPRQGRFVGSHPLAGSEQRGPQAASAELFVGRRVILTPPGLVSSEVVQIEGFWKSLGAVVTTMDPAEHDRILATTSHLPHLVAAALAGATEPGWLPYTAGGWRDTTRVAAGDPALWREIFLANREEVCRSLAAFQERLRRFAEALDGEEAAAQVQAWLSEAKQVRDQLRPLPGQAAGHGGEDE